MTENKRCYNCKYCQCVYDVLFEYYCRRYNERIKKDNSICMDFKEIEDKP